MSSALISVRIWPSTSARNSARILSSYPSSFFALISSRIFASSPAIYVSSSSAQILTSSSLMKLRSEFRRVLMDMGSQEMPTNRYVESSFWNFDSLFQPQSHPARDAHDTFFLTQPKYCKTVPEDYYKRVHDMHENGGFDSIGHGRGAFKRETSMTNILRTHTTAISAQMLYKLANQPGGFTPQKYFSIDRVFRDESMDATHLAEFHQVEGVVADYDLSLGDLIGIIKAFFLKIDITQMRFKPAYNPYTEPSMEIFAFHPDLKKWTEIGNSGVFCPEMLRPMGLPENVRVIAWGLSLERPTMITSSATRSTSSRLDRPSFTATRDGYQSSIQTLGAVSAAVR
ncbi:hypothetical protein PHYPSEUDO_002497 [Phytophthora pseudosyringae]|uniref:phenylalanine--tRNA ligase n=1 Tax=Phytophthora pseudosyringae TaxID=221518 RepID=A0A8T1V298_9STRA|nr:hypothetical protein PHYPSEUDO_002497 [Phytophthora pseudosyringae]